MSNLRSYLLACAVIATAAGPAHAGSAPDVLVEAATVCTTHGVSEDLVRAQLGSLGWKPIAGDMLSDWHLRLFASPFLANAAYDQAHAPTWKQAWKDGFVKSRRSFVRSKHQSTSGTAAFFELPEWQAVLQLGTRALPTRAQLFCTVAIADDPVTERETVPNPIQKHLQPADALTLFLSVDRQKAGGCTGMTGVNLNQSAISSEIGGAMPADAFISTYVNVTREI